MAPVNESSLAASARQPWCPICRLKVSTRGVYQPPSGGFYEVFADHGCDGDGKRVKDFDYGFVREGTVVPSWEFLP